MTNMNSVCLVGNVVRDIGEKDFAFVGNGTARLNSTIAVNKAKKQGDEWIDEVSYIDFTVWSKLAENLKKMLFKGCKIAVNGYLKQDRWKDAKGENRTRLFVVAETVDLMNGRNANQSTEIDSNAFEPKTDMAESDNGFGEDIPF